VKFGCAIGSLSISPENIDDYNLSSSLVQLLMAMAFNTVPVPLHLSTTKPGIVRWWGRPGRLDYYAHRPVTSLNPIAIISISVLSNFPPFSINKLIGTFLSLSRDRPTLFHITVSSSKSNHARPSKRPLCLSRQYLPLTHG
jgi:hypothetical protein